MWKGEATQGTISRANDIQMLVNREARVVTGCFWTINLGICQWSQDSDQQQPSWRTDSNGSNYSYSAYRRVTKQRRWSATTAIYQAECDTRVFHQRHNHLGGQQFITLEQTTLV